MKLLKELLTEAPMDYYGLVISTDRETGEFEDVDLVDYATDNPLGGQPSHALNMFKGIVEAVRGKNGWNQLGKFLQQNSRQQKELGEDFGDAENFSIIKYGPYTADELGFLIDKIEEA